MEHRKLTWSRENLYGSLNFTRLKPWVAVWLSCNVVGRINEVTLRRVGLVLRWVTVL